MNYYTLEPEVAGGCINRFIDQDNLTPVAGVMRYMFSVWLGDELLAGYPVFICTDKVAVLVIQEHLTGAEIADVEITIDEEYSDYHPDADLPHFHWLKIVGVPGKDDFGNSPTVELVVSEKALKVLRRTKIDNATITPYTGEG